MVEVENMRQERLTGLISLNIHHTINISINYVINKFSAIKKRNVDFVL